jgi:AAA15 family ATPase/GTPase
MLSYIELKNFKSFPNLKFDLRGAHGIPKKMAFIYGENGVGKSNLMLSMLFLQETLKTMQAHTNIKDIMEEINKSDLKNKLRIQIAKQIARNEFQTLDELISKYKMIDSNDIMSLKFGFYINNHEGYYYMEFDDHKIIYEELKYQINERIGQLFAVSEKDVFFSPSIFSEESVRLDIKNEIQKFWGKHTLLSILYNMQETENSSYIEKKFGNNLITILEWLNNCTISCKYGHDETTKLAIPFEIMRNMESGTIPKRKLDELHAFEDTLRTFFTSLYSDIKDLKYDTTEDETKIKYELYFSKIIGNKIVKVPFSLESTGTRKLLSIFPFIFTSIWGCSVFIDEIDSGIHDLLISNIINLMDDSIAGQFIATTHNTLLLENLSPENVYVISADAFGNKEVVCVSDFKVRTQKNNNIRKKYLHGDYNAIPYMGYLDLNELVVNVFTTLKKPKLGDGNKQ